MSRQILIDSYFGLVRTAISEGATLMDYYEESPEQGRTKGNIYRGVVKKVDAPIQAAFVRFGGGRDGFLPLRDAGTGNKAPKPGDTVLVQVVKDEVGDKGAALTTKLSLSGRYLVYIPDRDGEGGISSRITDEERAALKKILGELQIPEGGSVILRTAAMNKGTGELQADLDRLTESYREISDKFAQGKDAGLLFREVPPALRYLREYYTPEVERIWVNQEEVLNQCRQFFYLYEPKSAAKVVLSQDGPLMFQKLGLEADVEKLTSRKVALPSGANIIIDQAEALVAIDVNSAKAGGRGEDGRKRFGDRGRSDDKHGSESARGESEAMRPDAEGAEGAPAAKGRGKKGRGGKARKGGFGSDLEETVFSVNLEAAVEIARQLRLRDLGGIIIVDFIDMEDEKHRRQIEEAMRKSLSSDKAKVKVYDISPLGIMQISRQRLRKAGPNFTKQGCESCQGRGWHPSPSATALTALRKMEERLYGKRAGQSLAVTAPYPVANKLLNDFREHISSMERRFGCTLRVNALPAASGECAIVSLSAVQEDGKHRPEQAAQPVQPAQTPRGRRDGRSGEGRRPDGRRPEGRESRESKAHAVPVSENPDMAGTGMVQAHMSEATALPVVEPALAAEAAAAVEGGRPPDGRGRRSRTGRGRGQAGQAEGGNRKPSGPSQTTGRAQRTKPAESPARAAAATRPQPPARQQAAAKPEGQPQQGEARGEPHRRRRRSRRGKGGGNKEGAPAREPVQSSGQGED